MLATPADLEEATSAWVHWYNTQRLMHRLGRNPPAEAKAHYHAKIDTATPAAHTNEVCTKPGTLHSELLAKYTKLVGSASRSLIARQGGQHVLYGSALALTATSRTWSNDTGRPVPELAQTAIR